MSLTSHLLRPLDKLFVKDGRPLSLEEDSAASGLFPPPPSVLYGALRSAVLAKATHPRQAIGTDADPAHGSKAAIKGVAFAKTDDGATRLYFPAPADLVRDKEKDKAIRLTLPARRLQLSDHLNDLTSNPTPRYLRDGGTAPVEGVGGYLSEAGLRAYLAGGEVPAAAIATAEELYGLESKLGIGLDYRSGTTKDGLLYTMAMQRLREGVRLALQTEGFDGAPGLVRLGAEARAAERTTAPELAWPAAPARPGDSFTLYLATPGVFRNGWLPDFLSGGNRKFTGQLGGATVELLAASTGRYLPLGGWDIMAGHPKPMRKAVPAGSVYHLRITGGALDVNAVHGRALPTAFAHAGHPDGDRLAYPRQGFAIAYLGAGPTTLNDTKA